MATRQNFCPLASYLTYQLREFINFFFENYVRLPLEKGGGISFNLALFQAAGDDITTDFNRIANLLQINSAFGIPMETIDTLLLVSNYLQGLIQKYRQEPVSNGVQAIMAAITEGFHLLRASIENVQIRGAWHPRASRIPFSEVSRKPWLWTL